MKSAPVRTCLKVLFLAPEDRFFWGHSLPVARAALRAGYEVLVAAGIHSYAQQILAEGFQFIPLRLKRNSYLPWHELSTLRELKRIYSDERPDIVHHLSLKAVLYGSIAASAFKDIRTVNAVTGLGFLVASPSWKARLIRPLVWSACRHYLDNPNQRVLVENQEDGQMIVSSLGVDRERVIVTRGAGVDVEAFRPGPEPTGTPVVLLASRMLWIKGVEEFFEAARLLHARGVNARFALVGDTDSSNPACIPRRQLLDWHASGEVEWWGNRPDMQQVLREASLVCLPSHGGEGIPKVLMEAAACGRPLVATDVPGCRDIVRHGVNGMVVPPRHPQALSSAIEELLKNSSARQQMALRSRELAANEFAQHAVVQQTLALYSELLNSATRSVGGAAHTATQT
jgi:glycosyltransferase involved in cell wall biosynthesis